MNFSTGRSGDFIEAAAISPPASPDQPAPAAVPRPVPEKPPVIIEPSGAWVPLKLRDLWEFRELLYFLTWRDVKVRYKQTLLGAAWAVLQPLIMMVIATFLFGRMGGMETKTGGIPYPLFAFAGLLPWTFFAYAITNGGNSVVGSSNLISKVYFPRLLVPTAAVAAGLVDFAIAAVLMLALFAFYGRGLHAGALLIPGLVVLLFLYALAMGTWISALNVKYRDIRHAIPFLVQAGMLLSPVYYDSAWIAPRWHWAMLLNPLTGVIDNFRAALFGTPFNWPALGVSTVLILGVLVASAYSFRSMEKTFADII